MKYREFIGMMRKQAATANNPSYEQSAEALGQPYINPSYLGGLVNGPMDKQYSKLRAHDSANDRRIFWGMATGSEKIPKGQTGLDNMIRDRQNLAMARSMRSYRPGDEKMPTPLVPPYKPGTPIDHMSDAVQLRYYNGNNPYSK